MSKIHTGEKAASSTNGAGKMEVHIFKNEIRFVSITLNKTQLQVDQRPKYEIWSATKLGENTKSTL